ncbi:MAG: hypothetical protein NTU44_17470 [Bacteroidetes bacterium]|nr:hypothetical protein [Bacteroidota bacterium]
MLEKIITNNPEIKPKITELITENQQLIKILSSCIMTACKNQSKKQLLPSALLLPSAIKKSHLVQMAFSFWLKFFIA